MIVTYGNLISFDFLNHKDEVERRTVRFIGIEYGTSPHFPDEEDWFLVGLCLKKGETRNFKLRNISNAIISLN